MHFPDLNFIPITKYAWDQKDGLVKIYLTTGLDKIGSHDKNNMQIDFDYNSVDLKIRDFNGKHWRFRIEPLHKDIDVVECKMQVKSSSITITLKKREASKFWSDLILKAKETKAKK